MGDFRSVQGHVKSPTEHLLNSHSGTHTPIITAINTWGHHTHMSSSLHRYFHLHTYICRHHFKDWHKFSYRHLYFNLPVLDPHPMALGSSTLSEVYTCFNGIKTTQNVLIVCPILKPTRHYSSALFVFKLKNGLKSFFLKADVIQRRPVIGVIQRLLSMSYDTMPIVFNC